MLAVFSLVCVMAGFLDAGGLNTNGIWIDLRWLPGPLPAALLAGFGLGIMCYAWLPVRWQRLANILTLAVGLCCLRDAAVFYSLLARARICAAVPLPLSLLTGLVLIGRSVLKRAAPAPNRPRLRRLALGLSQAIATAVVAAGLLLGQILLFGSTNYSRPADAIVVFGAGVEPDGRRNEISRRQPGSSRSETDRVPQNFLGFERTSFQ